MSEYQRDERLAADAPPYDMSIHCNPDARAWGKFFKETCDKMGKECDEDWMAGWFANAMMAMHDHLYAKRDAKLSDLKQRLQEAEKEGLEQAKLLGMSGEREADLRGKLQRAEQDLLAHQKNTDQEVGDLTQQIEQLEAECASYRQALVKLKRPHQECEDGWYSCPESEEGCYNDSRSGCDCGAEAHNEIIDKALASTAGCELLERLEKAEKAIEDHNSFMNSIIPKKRPKSVVEGLLILADWFDEQYPNDPEPHVQEDLRKWAKEIESLESRLAASEKAREQFMSLLALVLPMAKGYAQQHRVGSNQAFCDEAEQALNRALSEPSPQP